MTSAEQTRQRAAVSDLLSRLPRRVPRATYRLQFNNQFTLDDAAQQIAYLDALGISDLYASPLLMARLGSGHGYDITDHGRINPDIGGDESFERLSTALRAHQMGLILDVVPNHMGIGDTRNGWWTDVLENGPISIYASYFDIDWDPVPQQLRDKVLLPILGDQYGNVLERGELKLRYGEGAFFIDYWENTLPVNPRSYGDVLSHRLEQLLVSPGPDDADVMELQSIITAVGYLPPRTETDPNRIAERNREKEVIKRRLNSLYGRSAAVREAIEATVGEYNGRPGQVHSFDLLETLINKQPYRLAFWRVATDEINYRRFFDINDLAAIRVELPEVLQATHQLVFRLLAEGKASGLRIDHPDGLWNPPSYFRQLQENYLRYWVTTNLTDQQLIAPDQLEADVTDWLEHTVIDQARQPGATPHWSLYVVAEKILSHGETLPDEWAVDGTTGYDFLNEVNGVFVDPASRRALDRLYADVAGPQPNYANLVNGKKKQIMLVALASEINTLSHLLDRLSERNRRYRDFTLNSLTFAMREVIAGLPVYRTYISGPGSVTPWDERFIEAAVRDARRRNPRTAGAIFDFIHDTLLLRNLDSFAEDAREEVLRFVMKFQQLSGPVMAKGVEDTTFYIYNRLVSLNEVGGHPEYYGNSVAELHARATARSRRWPHSMLASSTHDTKRSEDARARINVLSEMPREWRQMVGRWSRLNARKKTELDGQAMPSRNDEYLLYQSLLGVWPDEPGRDGRLPNDFCDRIAGYMQKATREAKVHTSWVNPNADYDAAVEQFVSGILDERRSKRFLESIQAFSRRVAYFGRFNSLSQTLVKLTAPGVPDIYQGCELWDLSLVDPDNRRPVNYVQRAALLAELHKRIAHGELGALADELLRSASDGRIKLYLTVQALAARRARPELFADGEYVALTALGEHGDHVVAFARCHGGAEIISVAPRLTLKLAGGEERPPLGELWGDTWLPLPYAGSGVRYRDLLTGAELLSEPGEAGEQRSGLRLRDVLARFPVALLERVAGG